METFGIIVSVIGGVVLLLAILCCKTIRIAIAVIKQSMKCIAKVPIIFIFPIFTVILMCGHLIWSLPSAYFMYLLGSYDAKLN